MFGEIFHEVSSFNLPFPNNDTSYTCEYASFGTYIAKFGYKIIIFKTNKAFITFKTNNKVIHNKTGVAII